VEGEKEESTRIPPTSSLETVLVGEDMKRDNKYAVVSR